MADIESSQPNIHQPSNNDDTTAVNENPNGNSNVNEDENESANVNGNENANENANGNANNGAANANDNADTNGDANARGNEGDAGQRGRAHGNRSLNININQRNIQNNAANLREHIFQSIYFKLAILYAQTFSEPVRRFFEYFILLKALLFFAALIYIHMSFIKHPSSCLDSVQDWPREGILRIEIIANLRKLLAVKEAEIYKNSMRSLHQDYFYGIGPKTKLQLRNHHSATNLTYTQYWQQNEKYQKYLTNTVLIENFEFDDSFKRDDKYIVEYSLEYGYLRLSPRARERLQIPIRLLQLDPDNDKCFGNTLTKFMLREFLGYDDLLMASVRVIAEGEGNKGYLHNAITGEHFRFISTWWTSWSSYPTAFFVMLVFTFSISTLLRFSHNQVSVFIDDVLYMLELNMGIHFPIGSLLIIVLALVGMESLMSQFFNDTTTAFFIIVIVWLADQFDEICCHANITKRHWLRFFFLYHFAFYGYHYRFSGQNRGLALVSSWLFIQHSMVYFFHHYELPLILQQTHVFLVGRRGRENGDRFGANQQRRGGEQIAPDNNRGHGRNRFRFISLHQRRLAQRQLQRQQVIFQDPMQQLPQHLLLIRDVIQGMLRANLGPMETIRRLLVALDTRDPMRLQRAATGDLQYINLGGIQIVPENRNTGTTSAAAATAVIVVATENDRRLFRIPYISSRLSRNVVTTATHSNPATEPSTDNVTTATTTNPDDQPSTSRGQPGTENDSIYMDVEDNSLAATAASTTSSTTSSVSSGKW